MAKLPTIAEEAVKKIDSKLECSICDESFKEPKLLPCFHVFCKHCLERQVVQGPEGQSLTCPTCRYQITLPDIGVAGLQTDFCAEHLFEMKESLEKAKKKDCENCKKSIASKFCQQCKKLMCDKCTEMHENWGDFNDHVLLGIDEFKGEAKVLSTRKTLHCEIHPTKKLKIYCNTCTKLICNICVASVHKDHSHEYIEESFPRHKEELVSSLAQFKHKLIHVQQSLKAFDARVRKTSDQRTAIESRIHSGIDQLHQLLDQRRAELVATLDKSIQEKLKNLAPQRDLVELAPERMSSCLEYAEAGLDIGSEGEVLRMKEPILKRIEEINAEFDPSILQPKTEADIELVTDDQAHRACQEYGEIFGDPDSAENSYATGEGTSIATIGKQAYVQVHLTTRKYNKYFRQRHLKAELVHAQTRTRMRCEMSYGQENGQHTISYQPVYRGRHSLHITVNGRHIYGSPYPIAVTPSIRSLQRPTRVARGLGKPYGVTVNSKGHMVVVELARNRISILNPEGGRMLSFGTRLSGDGQFKFPYGVTVDHDDNIYVVEVNNNRIQKFDPEGNLIAAVGEYGSGELEFIRPAGICFNKSNEQLYVCDQNNYRIQVITTDLTFVRHFGSKGDGTGQFNCPLNLAFDSRDNLYVTDCGNNRVQVFTAEGQFVRAFTDKAYRVNLENPYAIAIDSGDTVYVSESYRNCVNVFTTQGKFITSFGTKGTKDGQYYGISGLCVDQNDYIIVSDSTNNRLQII